MTSSIHRLFRYDVDSDADEYETTDAKRCCKYSQIHKEYVDSETDAEKYHKSPKQEHESLRKTVENYGKRCQYLEIIVNEALKEAPQDIIKILIDGIKIDMEIIKIQLDRVKFYQLLVLVFGLATLFLSCVIYKKIIEEDLMTFGKIYSSLE